MNNSGQCKFDPSIHLSEVAKSYKISPLKGIFKYLEKNPGMANLAGGLPNASYFPFETLEGEVLPPTAFVSGSNDSVFAWIRSLFGYRSSKAKGRRVLVPKYQVNPEEPNLALGLQYGSPIL